MPHSHFPRIYGITDPTLMPNDSLFSKAESALIGGLQILQYRNKIATDEQRLEQALQLKTLCDNYGATLIINDDVELAIACKADGVHLGQEDKPLASARAALGEHAIIGVTCHDDINLAKAAATSGANYVAFGRFFSSKTKASAREASLSILQRAKSTLRIPLVAIGGINVGNAKSVLDAGADCIAICDSLFSPTQPGDTLSLFKQLDTRPHR